MKILDLSPGYGQSSLYGRELTADEKEKAVWIATDNAFSEPVTTSDDRADYAPTQILAELFRSARYDAIAYKSHFGDDEDARIAKLAPVISGAVLGGQHQQLLRSGCADRESQTIPMIQDVLGRTLRNSLPLPSVYMI